MLHNETPQTFHLFAVVIGPKFPGTFVFLGFLETCQVVTNTMLMGSGMASLTRSYGNAESKGAASAKALRQKGLGGGRCNEREI